MEVYQILFLVAIFLGLYTAIFSLLTIYERWGNHKTRVARTNLPSVCVVIPCFNEEQTLARTLDSVLALDYPKDLLEVVVVDDGSSDNTLQVAKSYKSKGVIVYAKKNGGKHTALNYALKRTKAEIVGALDADSTVAKNALRKIVWYFRDQDVMAVTPSMKIDSPKGLLRRIQSVEFVIGVLLRRVFADLGSQHVTPGPFTMYRMSFFEKHGLYRKAHMTEDIEVALRIQSKHYLIENATDAYVYTHGPGSWRGLYKQRIRWYYGFLSNILDYRHLFSREHGNLGLFILPMSFLSIGVLATIASYTLGRMIYNTAQNIYFYWLIGFDWRTMFELNLELFFLNTNIVSILGVAAFLGGLSVMLTARYFAQEKGLFLSYILFLLCYSWLYVFWWLAAFYHKIFNKKMSWGHKSKVGR